MRSQTFSTTRTPSNSNPPERCPAEQQSFRRHARRCTRSVTFSPAGPAPLITTSGPPVAAGTRPSSGPTGRRSRRQVQTGGGDQIEERATDGVSGHTGEGKLAGGGLLEEGETDDAGQAAADDHRPLPAQSPS